MRQSLLYWCHAATAFFIGKKQIHKHSGVIVWKK